MTAAAQVRDAGDFHSHGNGVGRSILKGEPTEGPKIGGGVGKKMEPPVGGAVISPDGLT